MIAAGDGKAAVASARSEKPDLVVLDLGLPALNGLDVARVLRRESRVPIIMLTARADESDKLVGLELGADDYIAKPFSPKELVARVRAVLRRVTTPLGDMLEAIGRIADGDYTTRMAEYGTPEMRALARAVNRMTARLRAAMSSGAT